MKKKKTPYLDFYKKCMETGRIPDNGLCNCFESQLFEYVKPLLNERQFGYPHNYWAFGEDTTNLVSLEVAQRFTPLRQTIVLFMACLNNEL